MKLGALRRRGVKLTTWRLSLRGTWWRGLVERAADERSPPADFCSIHDTLTEASPGSSYIRPSTPPHNGPPPFDLKAQKLHHIIRVLLSRLKMLRTNVLQRKGTDLLNRRGKLRKVGGRYEKLEEVTKSRSRLPPPSPTHPHPQVHRHPHRHHHHHKLRRPLPARNSVRGSCRCPRCGHRSFWRSST